MLMAMVPGAPATSLPMANNKLQRETWRKMAKLNESHPARAAAITCWDSLTPRLARYGSSLEVAIHDSCTLDENVVMDKVGGGVGGEGGGEG